MSNDTIGVRRPLRALQADFENGDKQPLRDLMNELQAGANGDMGENNTAAMDPIFFFHHCFVDRVFWLWQQLHDRTTELPIRHGYAGTDNAGDGQGPTPGLAPGTRLTTDTPLTPFVKDEFGTLFTSMDCVDIESQLGYTYEDGSLAALARDAAPPTADGPVLVVSGIDRAYFQGSFVVRAYASAEFVADGDPPTALTEREWYLGHHSVLSRRNIVNCANCLRHLEVVAHFPLDPVPADLIDSATYRVEIQHRGEVLPDLFDYTTKVVRPGGPT